MNWFKNKNIITCDYCNSDSVLTDDLRCKSCGAPLKINKGITSDTPTVKSLIKETQDENSERLEVRGGQGNYRLISFSD